MLQVDKRTIEVRVLAYSKHGLVRHTGFFLHDFTNDVHYRVDYGPEEAAGAFGSTSSSSLRSSSSSLKTALASSSTSLTSSLPLSQSTLLCLVEDVEGAFKEVADLVQVTTLYMRAYQLRTYVDKVFSKDPTEYDIVNDNCRHHVLEVIDRLEQDDLPINPKAKEFVKSVIKQDKTYVATAAGVAFVTGLVAIGLSLSSDKKPDSDKKRNNSKE